MHAHHHKRSFHAKASNVSRKAFFQAEVPTAFQLPIAAKFLAMSRTVDVIVIAHGDPPDRAELLRSYQTTALATNVPIVPCEGYGDVSDITDIALQMAEIRQQAVLGQGVRKSNFFGIGDNTSKPAGKRLDTKVYF